ncbi:hypothetical protein SAMN04515674_102160 [Pseudarcicella hirudinis]|uniref:Uncharacterized protein n=1 Tax=Pseudarcicella hirudinis TaxID=1079859 RepID=A0A1I5NX61_9BACT|nr:hypothetical protein SAMN04515674_102160 [Pseudarcicella hirudinis]
MNTAINKHTYVTYMPMWLQPYVTYMPMWLQSYAPHVPI